MRITVSVPQELGEEARRAARDESISVSRLFAEAIEHYLRQAKRHRLGKDVLDLIGETEVSDDALETLDAARVDARA